MVRSTPKTLLWLFVINLGIVFGAGIYESRIIVPQWASALPESLYRWNAEATRRPDPGRNFWAFVTTGPLTLLTLANLVAAWRAQGATRRWWLGATAAAVVDRIFTFAYFIPRMLKLQRAEAVPESEVVAMAAHWERLDYVRHAIVLVAWLAALKAFSSLSKQGG
jgi:Domain of unknown function (DUF1772)